MTVVLLSRQVVIGSLANGASRFFAPAREAGELRVYIAAVRGLLFRATIGLVLMALVIVVGLAAAGQMRWIGIGLVACCLALPNGYSVVLNGIQSAARRRVIVALHQGVASWGRYLLALGFIALLGATSFAVLTGYLCAMLMVVVSQWIFFRRTICYEQDISCASPTAYRQWKREIWHYSWPFAMFGVFTSLHVASDRWSLQMFATTRDVGIYTVLYQLGYYPITMLVSLLVQLVRPVFYEQAGDASDAARVLQVHKINRRLTMLVLLLTGIGSVLALMLHGFIFRWLVSPEYRVVSWLLPGMVLAGGLFAAGQFTALSLMSEAKTTSLLWPKMITALAGIGLNIGAAKFYGVKGVVGAYIVFSMLYFGWIHLLVGRRRRLHSIIEQSVGDAQ